MAKNETISNTIENNEALLAAKNFWDKYRKIIVIFSVIFIGVFVGYFGYKNWYQAPREDKAKDAMFMAESIFDEMSSTQFNKDSVDIVINGSKSKKITGLLTVIKQFDGTLSAERAKYMVGACYFQIKEYDKSIKWLKDFNANGAKQIQSFSYTLLGHAYAEKKNNSEAFKYYKKAVEANEKDEILTPQSILLAARYAEHINKNEEAIELYKKLKENFPSYLSVTNGDVEKRLAALGVLN
jgi:tetratricopeptide (TPR) repeat protein